VRCRLRFAARAGALLLNRSDDRLKMESRSTEASTVDQQKLLDPEEMAL
jgi:hypothetical protein